MGAPYSKAGSKTSILSEETLEAIVAVGNTGAATLSTVAQGVKSVTAGTTGQYAIVLDQKYEQILDVASTFGVPTTGISAVFRTGLIAANLVALQNTDTINLVCVNAAGAATFPVSGETMILKITVGSQGK